MREYGVLDSWNKLCVLPIEISTDFIGFTNYGLLLVRHRSRLVSTNSELERKDKSVLIDPEALHEKEISNQIDYHLDVATYMENLALLDGANMVSYWEDVAGYNKRFLHRYGWIETLVMLLLVDHIFAPDLYDPFMIVAIIYSYLILLLLLLFVVLVWSEVFDIVVDWLLHA